MAAPTFVSSTNTTVASGSTAKTTASIAVQNGDVLVAYGLAENSSTTIAIATATGSTSAWTLKRDVTNTGVSNPYARAWTATATATGNITVSFTLATGTIALCGIVKVWRNSGGIGATNVADNNQTAGSPSVGVTTTGANSALDFANTDWNGVTGTATFTASSGTPVTDLSNQTSSANYCVYSAHVLDAGAIGAKTFGMSAPAAQRYICDVIEILGSASAAITSLPFRQLEQAAKRLIAPAILAGGLFWCPQPIAASPSNTVTIEKWQQPLSRAVPVAQAVQGHATVPFNTAQATTVVTYDKYQQPLSTSAAIVKPQQGTAFVPFNTLQNNTVTVDKWLQPLSMAVALQAFAQGAAFVPFDTVQTTPGLVTYDKYQQPLSVVPTVYRAQPGFSFVPFDTPQIVSVVTFDKYQQPLSVAVAVARAVHTPPSFVALDFSQAPLGWYQPLSVSALVARPQQGTTFVPFDTAQAAPVGVSGMAWFMPLGTAPATLASAMPGYWLVPFNTAQSITQPGKRRPTLFMSNLGRMMGS